MTPLISPEFTFADTRVLSVADGEILFFEAHATGGTIRKIGANQTDIVHTFSDPVTSFEFFDSNADGVLDVFAINRNAVGTQVGVRIWNGADFVYRRRPTLLGFATGPVYAVAPMLDIDGNLAFAVAGESSVRSYSHNLSTSSSIPGMGMKVRQLKRIPAIKKYVALVQAPTGFCSLISEAGVCLVVFQPDFSSFSTKGLMSTNILAQRSLVVTDSTVYVAQSGGTSAPVKVQISLLSNATQLLGMGSPAALSIALFDADNDGKDDLMIQSSSSNNKVYFQLTGYPYAQFTGGDLQYFAFKDATYEPLPSTNHKGINRFFSVVVDRAKITLYRQTLDCQDDQFDMDDSKFEEIGF